MRHGCVKICIVACILVTVCRPAVMASDFTGTWTGVLSGTVESEGSFTFDTVLILDEGMTGSMAATGDVSATHVFSSGNVHISGNTMTIDIPPEEQDRENPDCADWNCPYVFVLDASKTILAVTMSGTVCGPDHGLAANFSGTLARAAPPQCPPDAPTAISPSNGAMDVSVTPTLTLASFSDPDTGDIHLQTDWDIGTSAGFTETVLYEQSRTCLTSLPVPDLLLEPATVYYWRARFYDNHSNVSEWSALSSFTTEQPQNDSNLNGIPDTLENTTVDLDSDGTADIQQNDIKSLNTIVGNGQIGVSIRDSATATAITRVESIDPDTISTASRPTDMDLGLFSFRVEVSSAGAGADVVVYFSTPAPADAGWYFYDTINGWQDYSAHAVFSPDRKSVTLALQDGGTGDADGIANSVIVDPCGFGIGSWIKGKVTDALTRESVANCTLTVPSLGLDVHGLSDGSFLSLILPGTYDVIVSAPGYQSLTLPDVKIDEAVIVTQNVSLTSNVGIGELIVTGSPESNSPLMFTLDPITADTVFYRFSMHPDYGTAGYDGTRWQLMTDSEYTSENTCTYRFTRPGKFIVVVWLTPVCDSVNSSGIPIIGWSVDTGSDACPVNFTGVSISGTRKVNMPLSFTVDADNPCPRQLYYRFSMHPDYGTIGYDGTRWQLMTDTEWTTAASIDYTFRSAGKYVVVVWVSETIGKVDPTGIPIIGWSIDIE